MTDAAHHMPVVRLAPAKLNLTLAVVGRRDDGFHDLHSVFVPLGLHDRLSLAPAGGAGGDTLHVTGGDAGPTEDEPRAPRDRSGARGGRQGPGRPATPPLAARLDKRIPVAAGLGGGSSDAAAAFDAALEAWGAREVVDARPTAERRRRRSAPTCRSSWSAVRRSSRAGASGSRHSQASMAIRASCW